MSLALPPAELRRVGNALADADGARLRAVVALLDAMPDRGTADLVLDPVRPRLRRLRPTRPLNFPRLLFMPLDPLIVPAPAWRRGGARVPRSVLAPIAQAVEREMGPAAASILAECAGIPADAQAMATAQGARLWPAAAVALPPATPPEWAACGLPAADYAPLAQLLRPLFANGVALFAALAAAGAGPPEILIHAALGPLCAAGSLPFQAGIAALLANAAAPGAVLEIAAALDPRLRPSVLAAIDGVLEAPLPSLDTDDLDAATATALATWRQLDALARCDLLGGPRLVQLRSARLEADAACRAHAAAAAQRLLVDPCRALPPDAGDAALEAVEADARSLRHFTAIAARLGSAAEHDRMLRATAATIRSLAQGGALGPVDVARLLEILVGSDAAAIAIG